jgi:hypothetical protein
MVRALVSTGVVFQIALMILFGDKEGTDGSFFNRGGKLATLWGEMLLRGEERY